jgi:hypothetical protein
MWQNLQSDHQKGRRDLSAFCEQKGHSSTYSLMIKEGEGDASAFSEQEGCGGTYSLIIEEGEGCVSAFSKWEGCSSRTNTLVIKGGVGDPRVSLQLAGGTLQHLQTDH